MTLNTFYRKLFLSPYFFTIAIRKRERGSVLDYFKFQPEFIVPATHVDWFADPMLVENEGRTWLFYEAVHNEVGHIEVAEVNEDCTLGTPTVVLKDDCHYSYPFVFRWNELWYMIPESSAAEEVRLYYATSFPYKWELSAILLKARAVDTTVYEKDKKLYMLTFLTDGLSERVQPHVYCMDGFPDDPSLVELSWTQYDTLRVRGAGPLFTENKMLYRPAQISQEQRYGDALAFYQVQTDKGHYFEQEIGELTINRVNPHYGYSDGLHTYCRSDGFEAIDIRCREFDLFKIPKKLMKKD